MCFHAGDEHARTPAGREDVQPVTGKREGRRGYPVQMLPQCLRRGIARIADEAKRDVELFRRYPPRAHLVVSKGRECGRAGRRKVNGDEQPRHGMEPFVGGYVSVRPGCVPEDRFISENLCFLMYEDAFDNATPDEQVRLGRVVSGGQTGVDRAALDAAIDAGLTIGGWCPRGRKAEDGVISEHFPLRETPSEAYRERTSWNVQDSDATLVVADGDPTGGTAFTIDEARRLGRPHLIVPPAVERIGEVRCWLARKGVETLNVAGPRESTEPGIYERAYRLLREVFASR